MKINIARALAEFQGHIIANLGKPVGLSTLRAFQVMMVKIIEAVGEKDDG